MRTYTITQEYIDKQSRIDPALIRGVAGPGEYTWNERLDRYEPIARPAVAQTAPEPCSIFGIGGIGIAAENEAPIIPSAAAADRYISAAKTARRCRKCHESEMDGAMFTTAPWSGLCDDCFDS